VLNGRFKMYLVARLCVLSSFNTNYKQWCSPEMLTRGGGLYKSVLNWGGEVGLLTVWYFGYSKFWGFFLVIVGQTFKIILIKNNCR
jgi:hypothetical protein